MIEATENKTGEFQKADKVETAKAEIIRGRMPVAVVALARFGNSKDKTTKELATLFGTTVGKIDDIKKNRNFAYVTKDFAPTQAQKDEGIAWLKKHPAYDQAGVDALVTELDSIPVASEEQAKAFEAARSAGRGQPTTTKDGATADGGGGNRRKPREANNGVAPAADAKPTGEALLS